MLYGVFGPAAVGKTKKIISKLSPIFPNVLWLQVSTEVKTASKLDKVVMHDMGEYPLKKGFKIPPNEDMTIYDTKCDYLVVDEVQFLSIKSAKKIPYLAQIDRERDIIVCGLDLDWKGNPFNTSAYLMACCEDLIKLRGTCVLCGENDAATYSFKNGGTKEVIEEVWDGLYQPMCPECWIERMQK